MSLIGHIVIGAELQVFVVFYFIFYFFGLLCFLQERNVVPSLKKTLNEISLEKDAAVVAKVLNTCFLLHLCCHVSDGLIMHAFSLCLLPVMLSRRML